MLKKITLLRPAALGLLAALFTAVPTASLHAPFALGLLATAGTGQEGTVILLSTALAAMLTLPFTAALPHLAVAVLIATASAAFRGSAVLTTRRAVAAVSAALFAAVGGIYAVQALDPVGATVTWLGGAVLTGGAAWFFHPLLRREREKESLVFLAAALALTLRSVTLFGVSLGRGLTVLLLLVSAPTPAVALGLGLMTDLVCAAEGCTAAFALGGILLSRLRRRGTQSLAFLAFLTLLPQSPFLEAAAAAAVYILLPRRLLGGKRVLKTPPAPDPTPILTAAWKKRVEGASRALREVYESLSRPAQPLNEENPAIVFDRAAERTCRACALCDLCWQKDYTSTFNALNDATPTLLERGRAMAKDFPTHFTSRCIHLTDFLTAVNGELSAFLLRRQYRRQLEETRRSARGQYAQLSELLAATAAGLGEGRAAAPCRIGAAIRPREGEKVCGDTVVSFPTEEGKWCLILSDGMGSGEAARQESALVCRLLRQFLESGIAPEAALKTLNAAMALRGAESGSFTTVDLCVCDPTEGEATVYKYGAAPTYLKKGGAVRRVAGTSLPVGLKGSPAPPDMTKVPLTPGSFLVQVSDGVADPTRDEWLQNLLAGWDGEDPQSLAGLILTESVSRLQGRDDCGIQILHCPKAEVEEV